MARKTRVTTSMSTLLSQADALVIAANNAGRKDLMASLVDLHGRIAILAADYVAIRNEIDPLVKLFLNTGNVADILAKVQAEAASDSE